MMPFDWRRSLAPCLTAATTFGALRARCIAPPTTKAVLGKLRLNRSRCNTSWRKLSQWCADSQRLFTSILRATDCKTAITYRVADTGRCSGRMWKVATADSLNSMLVTHTVRPRWPTGCALTSSEPFPKGHMSHHIQLQEETPRSHKVIWIHHTWPSTMGGA